MAYLDQMYSQTPATTGAPTGMTQYKPAKGVWQELDNQNTGSGDYWGQDTRNPWEKGFWKADPNADYGRSPGDNFGQMFDPKTGDFIGWQEKGLLSAGGSGLFGSFGNQKSLQQYLIDPTTGQWKDPTQLTVTPSKSAGTNIMSYAMPIAMAAGLGAGAAGGAFSGAGGVASGTSGTMTAAEAAALSAEAAGGVTGVGAGGAELGAGAGGLVELGGGGAGFTGSVPGITSTTALPGAGTASGGGSFLELLKEYGPKAYELVAGSPGKDGKGGSRGIMDLLAGYYSSQQNKDLSGNLKGMYSDQRGLQNPYNDLLRASYQDPNVFYGSNQWKGLESVYQNKIDRQAAKGGTIANPTDREVKLNNYAMQELEKFRGGLKDAVNAYDPTRLAPIAEKGYNVEANANNPMWAGAGRAGTGGPGEGGYSTENYIKQFSSAASTVEDIYKLISKWFT